MNQVTTKAYLIALDASLSTREYVIDSDLVTIGRDGNRCNIVAAGNTISRKHAQIIKDPVDGFKIYDLESLNGVYVNEEKIHLPVNLKDGDLIGLGSSEIKHFSFVTTSRKQVSWTSTLPPKSNWSIGRSSENDIALPFESVVSAFHAIIVNKKGVLILIDKKSLNGTWQNGTRIRKTKISPSDTIVIGSTHFRFQLASDGRLEINRRECGDDIQLDCVGVSLTVKGRHKQTKNILEDITLSIKPGEFVGILGPSGAGKSTLLKTLNGYIQPSSGSVLLNETSLHHAYDMFRSSIGYVPQDDILHQELSVEKSLEFIAKLRLPRDFSGMQRANIVDSTIEAIGLNHVRNRPIEQLSGGQRKRVSIGSELLTKPSVLFLDEPTSGLDPSVEEKIMRHFKKMALNGTTILITTHILYSLDLLDRIIVLSQGKLVFFGTPQEALHFFQPPGAKGSLKRPIEIFDLLENSSAAGPATATDHSLDSRIQFAQSYSKSYKNSKFYQTNITDHQGYYVKEIIEGTPASTPKNAIGTVSTFSKLFKLSNIKGLVPWRDFLTLTQRHTQLRISSFKRALLYGLVPILLALVTLSQNLPGIPSDHETDNKRKALELQLSGMTQHDEQVMKALLSEKGQGDPRNLATIIYSLKNEGVQSLPLPMSVMVMCVMTAVFLGTISTCLEISSEKSIYERERMSSLRIADYIGSKLPLIFLITLLQCCLFLGLLLINPAFRAMPIFAICPVIVAVAWSSAALGLLISSLDPTKGQLSLIFAIAVVLPQLILSGGLGPDYYNGLNSVAKSAADCIPARWGLEMMFSAVYKDIAQDTINWVPGFITNIIGFAYGDKTLLKGAGILAVQGSLWLLICGLLLKKRDLN